MNETALRHQASYAYHALLNSNLPGMRGVVLSPETGAGAGGDTAGEDDAQANAQAEAEAAASAAAQAQADLNEAEAAAAAAENNDNADPAALKAEKAALLREVMDKKNKLKEAERKAAEAAEKLAAYEGVDPEKVKELLRKEAEAERQAAEARGDFERVKSMMAEEHERETKSLKDRIAELEERNTQAKKVIDDLTIGHSFANSSYIRNSLTLTPAKARQLYNGHFELRDGVIVGYDKPAGTPGRAELVDASGNPLSFDEAFKRIIEKDPDRDSLLKANVAPGSGSSSTKQEPTAPAKQETAAKFGIDRIRASFEKA